jgi:hypothetical protein
LATKHTFENLFNPSDAAEALWTDSSLQFRPRMTRHPLLQQLPDYVAKTHNHSFPAKTGIRSQQKAGQHPAITD